MDPRPIDPKKIHEEIDACRPHDDDLALSDHHDLSHVLNSNPALRQSYERSRRWDAQVVRAMRDTPPAPAGLAERLLTAVQESEVQHGESPLSQSIVDACVHAAGNDSSHDVASSRVDAGISSVTRRQWLKNTAKIAVAIALCTALGAGVYWYRTPLPLTRDGLSAQAVTWVAALSSEWQSLEKAPVKYFPPGSVITTPPVAWQTFDTEGGHRAIVYDLKRARGRAYLFVVRTNASSPFSVTPSRLPSSGGWGMGAWKNGGSLYVLVVDEGRQRLEEFIRQPRTVAQSHFSELPLS